MQVFWGLCKTKGTSSEYMRYTSIFNVVEHYHLISWPMKPYLCNTFVNKFIIIGHYFLTIKRTNDSWWPVDGSFVGFIGVLEHNVINGIKIIIFFFSGLKTNTAAGPLVKFNLFWFGSYLQNICLTYKLFLSSYEIPNLTDIQFLFYFQIKEICMKRKEKEGKKC
jgi:hypothetical protein